MSAWVGKALVAAAATAPVVAGPIAVAAITAANAAVHRCRCHPRWHAVALSPLLLLLSAVAAVAAVTAVTAVATQIILPHAKRGYWRFWAASSAGQFGRQRWLLNLVIRVTWILMDFARFNYKVDVYIQNTKKA